MKNVPPAGASTALLGSAVDTGRRPMRPFTKV